MSVRFSNDQDYNMPTKNDDLAKLNGSRVGYCSKSLSSPTNIARLSLKDRMSTELNADAGMLHQGESLILDFPLEPRQHETHILKLATPLTKSSWRKIIASRVLKSVSESLRKVKHSQNRVNALDEEGSFDCDDEDDLRDSIHLTKRRFTDERFSWEETRTGLTQMVGSLNLASAPKIQQQQMRAKAAWSNLEVYNIPKCI